MKPPYKSVNNIWYTRALFWEEVVNIPLAERQEFEPPFTLMVDKPGKVNGRKTFVELGDPTGYKWAMRYLGDFEHWKALLKCKWFQAAYEEWINELETKIRSNALDKITAIAEEGQPAQSLVAAKYLAGFEWKDKQTRGRPTKQEVAGELKKAVKALEVEDADAERIGLRLVK